MLDMTKLAELHRERYNNVRIVGLDPTQEGDGPIGSFERFCRYGSLHFPKGRSRLNESQMYNGQSAYVTETKNHWAIRIPRLSSNCAGGQRCNQKKKKTYSRLKLMFFTDYSIATSHRRRVYATIWKDLRTVPFFLIYPATLHST